MLKRILFLAVLSLLYVFLIVQVFTFSTGEIANFKLITIGVLMATVITILYGGHFYQTIKRIQGKA